MNKIAIMAAVALLLLISGCTTSPLATCGDGSCTGNETAGNCPLDCGEAGIPPMPSNEKSNENPPELPF